MSNSLTGLKIRDTYHRVLQVESTGSTILNGLGAPVDGNIQSLTATNGFTGSLIGTASVAISGSHAKISDDLSPSTKKVFLTTGSVGGNQTITGSITITGNLDVLATASFIYVTSSTVVVNQNYLQVYTSGTLKPEGGFRVGDSGSANSGSLSYHTINNTWNFAGGDVTIASGSLLGTASYAHTSSIATSASHALFASASTSSSYALTASFLTGTIATASYALSSSVAVSSSYALSSSYAHSASVAVSSSYALSSSYAQSSSIAVSSSYAATASYSVGAVSSSYLSSGSIEHLQGIEFASASVKSAGERVVRWNDTEGTLDVGLKGGNITLQVGQEEVIRVNNTTGGGLLNSQYQVVRVSGVANQKPSIALATAATSVGSGTTLGLVAEDIPSGQQGFVILKGKLSAINTTGTLQGESWSNGDLLYLSPTTPGGITNIKPVSPQYLVSIGYVLHRDAAAGVIQVDIDNAYSIDDLNGVFISSSLTTGSILVYDGNVWTNQASSATASYALTASYVNPLNQNVEITQDLWVKGKVTAREFVVSSSVTNIVTQELSGSTKFGNTADDTHTFTGSLDISGSVTVSQTGSFGFISGTSGVVHSLTASNAVNSLSTVSASYAATASIATSSSYALTSSYSSFALTASYAISASHEIIKEVSSSYADTASIATSASYALTASYASQAVTASHLISNVYTSTVHVSGDGGSDATGDGTLTRPFQTITKALASTSAGDNVVIHGGFYAESPTLTTSNVNISAGDGALYGGVIRISGSLTVNVAGPSSTRITGLSIDNLIVQNTGAVYMKHGAVNTSTSIQGSGYVEFIDTDNGGTTTITGTSTVLVQGGKLYPATVNNAGAVLYVKDCITTIAPTALQGTLVITDSLVYSPGVGLPAVTSAAGTVVNLLNSQMTDTLGNAQTINIGGFLSYDDIYFDKHGSTLGTEVARVADFQKIRVTDFEGTGSLLGSASYALTASYAPDSISASYAATASYANDFYVAGTLTAERFHSSTVSSSIIYQSGSTKFGDTLDDTHSITGSVGITGSLTVSGTINLKDVLQADYLATANYSSDAQAAAAGIPLNGVYRTGNFLVVRLS